MAALEDVVVGPEVVADRALEDVLECLHVDGGGRRVRHLGRPQRKTARGVGVVARHNIAATGDDRSGLKKMMRAAGSLACLAAFLSGMV